MAVGKRLRFQIFRRDNFACRYCGLTAQDGAVLEVDHIKPRADGGPDHPTNLVTACEGCNSGKSDTPLRLVLVDDVPQADFRAAMAGRDAAEEDDPRVEAYFAWRSGFMGPPMDPRILSKFYIAEEYAWACGYQAEDIIAACYEAGTVQRPELRWFLPETKDDGDGPNERMHFEEAEKYLARFTSRELCPLIRHVELTRKKAGQPTMTYQHAVRAVRILVNHWENGDLDQLMGPGGRNHVHLREWLDTLDQPQGASYYLMRATAAWDSRWRGASGLAAIENPIEVLENAVALALREVPVVRYCQPCGDHNHAACVDPCDCVHPAPPK